MTDTQLRLGVIGCGRIAQAAHLPAIEKAHNVCLVAVSDPSPTLSGGVGRRYQVPSVTDTDELLGLDVDAVLIATPDRLHLPLGLDAIDAGKHVLMEKPLAASADEAQQLADAAARAGVLLQTGSMKRHDPGMRFAHDSLNRIGPILSVSSWYRVMAETRLAIQENLFPALILDEEVRARENTFKADGGRYLLATHGAHLFDGLRFLAGEIDWIAARTALVGTDRTWHGSAGIAATGGIASFEISVNVHSQWSEGVDIFGELGRISVRSPYAFTKLGSMAELYVESEGAGIRPIFAKTNPFTLQVESFAAAALGGLRTDPSPEDGVAAVRLIDAAYESSADGGREVRLG